MVRFVCLLLAVAVVAVQAQDPEADKLDRFVSTLFSSSLVFTHRSIGTYSIHLFYMKTTSFVVLSFYNRLRV